MTGMVLSESDKLVVRKMVEKALDDRLSYVGRDVAMIEREIGNIKKAIRRSER